MGSPHAGIVNRVSYRLSRRWAADKISRFEALLPRVADDRPRPAIVDIGCGRGVIASELGRRGYDVTAVDVVDRGTAPDVIPVIADASELPFDDARFDVGLLLTVLHHTHDPDRVLLEAARVANRLIVIEDTFHAPAKRRLVEIADSIANLEFRGHPHRNRPAPQWRLAFRSLGLHIAAERTDLVCAFFEQRTYALDTCRYR